MESASILHLAAHRLHLNLKCIRSSIYTNTGCLAFEVNQYYNYLFENLILNKLLLTEIKVDEKFVNNSLKILFFSAKARSLNIFQEPINSILNNLCQQMAFNIFWLSLFNNFDHGLHLTIIILNVIYKFGDGWLVNGFKNFKSLCFSQPRH